ncbi:MAG: SHOCT domain-containing protein [Anaerolineae bacterium]
MMMIGGVFVLLVIGGLLVVLFVVGAGLLSQRGGKGLSLSRPASPKAREILDQRYAHGEITEEEYRRMVKQLEV